MSGSQANTLKEFLVSIGWQVNADQQRQFQAALDSVTAAATRLSSAVESAASATVNAVQSMTDGLEQLYYSAQRAGTSALNMKAFEFGLSQIGLAASTSKQALQNFGMALALNPGKEGLLNALGVNTRDAKGGLKDTTELMTGFIGKLKGMGSAGFPVAAQYAQQFGLDPATLKQMIANWDAEQAGQKRYASMVKAAGIDMAAATRQAVEWKRELGDLGSVFSILATKIEIGLMDRGLPVIRRFRDYIRDHFDDIAHVVDTGLKMFMDFGTGIGTAIEGLGARFVAQFRPGEIKAHIDELMASFQGLKAAIGDLSEDHRFETTMDRVKTSLLALGKVAVLNAVETARMVIDVWAGMFRVLGDLFRGQWDKAWQDAKNIATGWMDGLKTEWRTLIDVMKDTAIGQALAGPFNAMKDAVEAALASVEGLIKRVENSVVGKWIGRQVSAAESFVSDLSRDIAGGGAPGGKEPIGVRQNNPGNLRHWDTEVGNQGGFAVFKSAFDGLVAMRNNLRSYAARGLDTVTGIINRWAPPSDHNDTGSYIGAVSKALGIGPDQHIDTNDPGMMQKLMQAMVRHEQGYNPYSSDAYAAATGVQPVGAGGSSGNTVIHAPQNVKMEVHGSRDPQRTASSVFDAQKRLNADLTRNLGQYAWRPAG